jgi:hypothetical protein
VNIEEQRAHYAAIKNRISGRVPVVLKPATKPVQPIIEYAFEREQRRIAMLANGMPNMAPDLRASVISMLQAYGVFWTEVTGKGRARRISYCRRAITWILHTRGWSFPRIGEFMKCDHSSAVYAIDKINSFARCEKRIAKKAKREWNGDPIPVPKLRGSLTASIEKILQDNETTWAHVIVKSNAPKAMMARRQIILFLHAKRWNVAKISRLIHLYSSNVSRCIAKYGKAS